MLKNISLAVFISLISMVLKAQCNFEFNDSFKERKFLKKSWAENKHHFVPEDIKEYPLIFQRFEDYHFFKYEEIQKAKLLNRDSLASCEDGNFCFGWYEEKWIEKYYNGKYIIKNIDSIQDLSPLEFPYVVMFFSILEYFSNGGFGGGRQGVYIWDRRNDKRYKVISAIGRSEMVWLLKNLCNK